MESKFTSADAVAALSTDITGEDSQDSSAQRFGAFVEHYQHAVFGFLGRMGFSQADSEDIAQEVFLKAWRYRRSYNPQKAQPSTWLFTIARNAAISKFSSKRAVEVPLDTVDIAAETQHQPERQLQNEQTRLALAKALRQLPLDDRCAIALFYIDDLSSADAASILQCKTATFKTRLSRARNKLKLILDDRDEMND